MAANWPIDLVAEAANRGIEPGSFLERLEDSPELMAAVPKGEFGRIFDGTRHLDAADAIIQDALASCVGSLPKKGE